LRSPSTTQTQGGGEGTGTTTTGGGDDQPPRQQQALIDQARRCWTRRLRRRAGKLSEAQNVPGPLGTRIETAQADQRWPAEPTLQGV
jgi:hypothetical protein